MKESDMENQYDVSVIIVNYKTSILISDCLLSLIDKTKGVRYEVIVIDNDSEPNFESLIKEKVGKDILSNDFHFLSLKENIGFGRANNEGLKIAKGRNIFFLNPDTILLNNAIKILSEFLDSHPAAGACGGNLSDSDNNPCFSLGRILPGVKWELDRFFSSIPSKIVFGNNIIFNNTDKPLKVSYIIGADLMGKKDVLKNVGGFSNDFFMFYEEIDLCYKIKKIGYEVFSVPDALIKHLEGKSFDKSQFPSPVRISFMETSRRAYLTKNNNVFSRIFSNLIYKLFIKSRISLINQPEKKEFYKKRYEIFRNIWENPLS